MESAQESQLDSAVAVIGMSGRFPGAESIQEFWNHLIQGKESISFFSDEELLESQVDPKQIQDPLYIRARGIIGRSEYFDAAFFGYSPREAELLDPQHRVFLECAWHAMEDAGYDPQKETSRIGILGGSGFPWYNLEISKNPQWHMLASGMSVIIANEKDYLATRVGYKLNLKGTSVSVQCACSTSLSAIVLGMQSLLMYQNDMVLAGGVSIMFPEKQGYLYEKGSLDSPDGHCRTFDSRAQGTVFSSGAGIVVLKRLREAMRDRDHIYCVIRGGAINNDGSTKVSYTAPSIQGQVAVETDALELSGVSADTISYVEAHGTATQVGDPIEIKALTEAFRQYSARRQYCAVGSVKTNIGHTDVASGVIGLIKVALSMQQQMLPPSLHFNTPNPEIDFENSPFFVNAETIPWDTQPGNPRRALVNSFGVGGANACVILEEAPVIASEEASRARCLLPFSAKSSNALDALTLRLLEYVQAHPEVNCADLCYTFQEGRALFDHRRFISFTRREELIVALSDSSHRKVLSIDCVDKNQDVVFMFPGQGNQYFGMGKELYAQESFFQGEVDRCCNILSEKLGYEYDLRQLFFAPVQSSKNQELVDQTVCAQPALFIVEYALAQFLLFLGVRPKAMIGHSIGEFVAACLAGVIGVREALSVVVERARLTQALPKGAMLAIFAGSQEVQQWLEHPIEISVINSPKLTIVSGPIYEIAALASRLTEKKVSCLQLKTSHAFHSHMMDSLIEPLKEILSSVSLSPPSIPILSTVTSDWMTDSEAIDPLYWAQHARKPVLFASAARRLVEEKNVFFIECGPGHSLESALKNCVAPSEVKIVGVMDSIKTSSVESDSFYMALGKLWALGASVSFKALFEGEKRKRLSLPGYPFERQKFVLDFKAGTQVIPHQKKGKIEEIGEWFYLPSWKKTLSLDEISLAEMEQDDSLWLVFHHNDGFGLRVIHELEKSHQAVCGVQKGTEFTEIFAGRFLMDERDPEHYVFLFKQIKERGFKYLRILHLWNLTQEKSVLSELEAIDEGEGRSFYGPLFLDQALIKEQLTQNVHLSLVGNQVYNLMNDKLNISKSLLIGPCRVLKNEYPKIQARLLDMPFPQTEKEEEHLCHMLFLENRHVSDEIVVAYRNLSRWVPIYDQLSLPKNESADSSLREGGCYLLTGGLGGIGLCLAQWIANKVRATLILIQRTALPPREEWDAVLERGVDQALMDKIMAIREIESKGSAIVLKQADVSSYSQMERVFQEIESSCPPVNGVLHCAGIPSGGVILLKTPEAAARVLKTKVRGTLILDKLLSDLTLDFFISCSSITAVLGEQGQVDYCAANAFLDAFSHQKSRLHQGIYRSINWGEWDVVGMAAEKPAIPNDIEFSLNVTEDGTGLLNERLELLKEDGDEMFYEVKLDPKSDWFIAHHRLNGVPTLVGTAFFDFLYSLRDRFGADQLCLTNVEFISPVMFFSKGEKSLKLKLIKSAGTFSFSFFSQNEEGADPKKGGQEHLKGQLSFGTGENRARHDVETLLKNLPQRLNVKEVYRDLSDNLLWVSPRWKSVRHGFRNEDTMLAYIELGDEYKNQDRLFSLHPALMDVAMSFSLTLTENSLYLPYGYEKVSVFAPLEMELYSYVRPRNVQEEIVVLDIDLLSPGGEILVSVEGYALKRVSETEGSHKARSTSRPSEHILPKEGVEVFDRYFCHLRAVQTVICSKDFNEMIELNNPSVEETEKSPAVLEQHPRPQLFTPYCAPTNEIENTVASIWGIVLGIQEIGIDDNFIELGGNSLSAIQVTAQLSEIFKLEFTVEQFLGNPTIRTLSDSIINQLIDLLDEEKIKEIASLPN